MSEPLQLNDFDLNKQLNEHESKLRKEINQSSYIL